MKREPSVPFCEDGLYRCTYSPADGYIDPLLQVHLLRRRKGEEQSFISVRQYKESTFLRCAGNALKPPRRERHLV